MPEYRELLPEYREHDEGRVPVIGIVGLGPGGRALGLALQAVKTRYEVWGHDRDAGRVREAQRLEAIDRGQWNLTTMAEGSDLLFLTEPLNELGETLETVAQYMRPGTLITDTASTKVPVMRVAERIVPEGVSFIGGHPILRRTPVGSEATPFRGATYCLVPLPSASEKAVQVLGDMVRAIGAQPYFIDAHEHDALVAGASLMPYLVDSLYMRLLGRSPSRNDLQRLAGPIVRDAASLRESEGRAAREALQSDPGHLVHWLDQFAAELRAVRDMVAGADTSRLDELLTEADTVRSTWEEAQSRPNEVAPEVLAELADSSVMRDLLGGRIWRRRDR